MRRLSVTIGADPEVFLTDKDNVFVSPVGLIPGTKEKPFLVSDGFSYVQIDGMAAEFNVHPSADASTFSMAVNSALASMQQLAPNHTFRFQPTVNFCQKVWSSTPPEFKILGCNPDYNAWTEQINPRPETPFGSTMRTGAGHIHLGWTLGKDVNDPHHFADCCAIVRQLDYHLGLPSLLWDKDAKRRTLYGKAGAFRPKPYGLEYRTLSNAWLNYPNLYKWIWNATFYAFQSMTSSEYVLGEEMYKNLAMEVIDSNDLTFFKTQKWSNIQSMMGIRTPDLSNPHSRSKKWA